MKKYFLITSLFLALPLNAQQLLRYRQNDPFLFCSEGQDRKIEPAPCWIPTPPYTGTYLPMPYCDPPNPYGKTWSAADTDSLQQYLTICPQALSSGGWTGNGTPDTVPFLH